MLRMETQGNYAVEFRVFDNGFAYRFITDLDREVKVRDEEFTFCLPDEHDMHLSFTNSFKTSYEQPYSHLKSDVYFLSACTSHHKGSFSQFRGMPIAL